MVVLGIDIALAFTQNSKLTLLRIVDLLNSVQQIFSII